KYEPKVTPVEREHGTPVTSDDVTGAVTVPGYPTEGKQPTVTVDEGAKLPDGNTSGKTDVPVTVRYPDGTEDHVTVPVTIGNQADKDKYEPKVTPVEREHGTPVTSDDVTGAVTVPGYPTEGKQPTVTVDEGAKLPDGNTSGKTDVPVTVRYPDGTEDHVTVPVTIGNQADKDKYEPKVTPVEREHGTPVTSDDVTGAVTVPGYPTEGKQPTVTVDEGAKLPDGNTSGKTDVPVTVRYPDGTEDHVTVPVTIGNQADKDKYEPKVTPVEKEHGTPVTSDDVTGAVTVPGYPTEGKQPTVTVDEGAKLPDGNTSGTTNIPVTVTYPDGSSEKVEVPVKIKDDEDNTVTPNVNPVTKGDKNITGHDGKPGHTVEVTLPDGTKVTGKVDEKGNWSVPVPTDKPFNAGDKVSVVEKDDKGHTSPATEVTVNDTENTAKQPTVDPVQGGDPSVSGKGTPGHTVEVTLPDGTKVTGEVDGDGNYHVDIP
ncbi:Rib/alpha-like domain-containing protein, partial [Staphylococcus sp. SQ8-PEA]